MAYIKHITRRDSEHKLLYIYLSDMEECVCAHICKSGQEDSASHVVAN